MTHIAQSYKQLRNVQLLITEGLNSLERSKIGFRNSKKKNFQDINYNEAYHYIKVKWYVELQTKEEKRNFFFFPHP